MSSWQQTFIFTVVAAAAAAVSTMPVPVPVPVPVSVRATGIVVVIVVSVIIVSAVVPNQKKEYHTEHESSSDSSCHLWGVWCVGKGWDKLKRKGAITCVYVCWLGEAGQVVTGEELIFSQEYNKYNVKILISITSTATADSTMPAARCCKAGATSFGSLIQ